MKLEFCIKYFASEGKARYFQKKVKGNLYRGTPNSKTREEYIIISEGQPGGYNEEMAAAMPYLVSWYEIK